MYREVGTIRTILSGLLIKKVKYEFGRTFKSKVYHLQSQLICVISL